ncbi:MAG: NUDIX hydrolase [Actinomycetota bacterium]
MHEPTASARAFEGTYVAVDVEDWPGIGPYEVVRRPGAAAVVPITPGGEVLLVRQFRPPVRDDLLEIPAGLLDVEGEDALSCAARELREETGYTHETIEFLGGCYASAGMTDEYVHLFWARTSPEPAAAAEPGIELVRRPFAETVAAARAGRVRDAKTALALLMAAGRVGADLG